MVLVVNSSKLYKYGGFWLGLGSLGTALLSLKYTLVENSEALETLKKNQGLHIHIHEPALLTTRPLLPGPYIKLFSQCEPQTFSLNINILTVYL